jgi:hypothetical protein
MTDEELYKEALNEVEPECSEDPDVIEETGVECEFQRTDDGWRCTTHNCHA